MTRLVCLLLLAAQPGPADTLDIQRAAARHARILFPGAALGLDPVSGDFVRPSHPGAVRRHSPERAQLIAEDLGARVIGAGDRICEAVGQADCVAKTVRIGAPAITGDTATVWVYARDARYSESENRKLLLWREGTLWRVAGTVEIVRVYFAPRDGRDTTSRRPPTRIRSPAPTPGSRWSAPPPRR
jgi:hypothetical protein